MFKVTSVDKIVGSVVGPVEDELEIIKGKILFLTNVICCYEKLELTSDDLFGLQHILFDLLGNVESIPGIMESKMVDIPFRID